MSIGFNANVGSVAGNADLGRIFDAVGSFGGHSVRIGNETCCLIIFFHHSLNTFTVLSPVGIMESGSSISALLLSGTISFGIRFASLCFRLAFRPSTKPYEDISYDTSCPSIIGFISVLALIPLERQALLWSICILQNKCIQTASAATIIIAYNMAVSQMKSPKIVDIYGLPGHCFVRVDSGKQCSCYTRRSLLVGGLRPQAPENQSIALWL